MTLPLPAPWFALWFTVLAAIVFVLPWLDVRDRRRRELLAAVRPAHVEKAITEAERVGPLRGPLPVVRPTPYPRGPIREIEAQRFVQPPQPAPASWAVELFREDDRRYRAIRSGLPLGTPDEHAVTIEIMRRLDALAPARIPV